MGPHNKLTCSALLLVCLLFACTMSAETPPSRSDVAIWISGASMPQSAVDSIAVRIRYATDKDVCDIVKANPRIEHLDLGSEGDTCGVIGKDAVAAISTLASLKSLVLLGNPKIKGSDVCRLLRIGTLEHLAYSPWPSVYSTRSKQDELPVPQTESRLRSIFIEGVRSIPPDFVKYLCKGPLEHACLIPFGALDRASIGLLSNCRTLRTLALSTQRLDALEDAHLNALSQLPCLVKLRLSGFSLTDGGLRNLCRSKTVEELHLAVGGISNDGFTALGEMKQLRRYSGAFASSLSLKLVTALNRISGLEALDISDTGICTVTLSKLNVSRLLQFSVTLNAEKGDWAEQVGALARLGKRAQLEVSMAAFGRDSLVPAIEALGTLDCRIALHIKTAFLSAKCATALMHCRTLDSLFLDIHSADEGSLKRFSSQCVVRELRLISVCTIGKEDLGGIGRLKGLCTLELNFPVILEDVVESIKELHNLESITLSDASSESGEFGELPQFEKVKVLGLHHLGGWTGRALRKLIMSMPNIERIELFDTPIACGDLPVLIKSIGQSCKCLRYLDLSHSRLDTPSMRCLRNVSTLRQVEYGGAADDEGSLDAIDELRTWRTCIVCGLSAKGD